MRKLASGDRVGVLTSGGDAPGMNAALWAMARVGRSLGLEMIGVEEGYRGLLERRFRALEPHTLDDAARRGGTWLGSSRSAEFAGQTGQDRARETIRAERLRALVVIGGNGSLTGADALSRSIGEECAIAGVPASIDNDIGGTAMAIGVDTALNTIVEACDRICDTATAHRRTFIVEVMGRDSGYLAMTAAIGTGADSVLIREAGDSDQALVQKVVRAVEAAYARDASKRRVLVIKAEGVAFDSMRLKEAVDVVLAKSLPGVDTRVTVLGHVVRGGAPSAFDRLLGARFGHVAVRALFDGHTRFMTGSLGPGTAHQTACSYDPYVVLCPFECFVSETKELLDGTSPLARWRKQIFVEVEPLMR